MILTQLNRKREEQSTSLLKVFGEDLVLELDTSRTSRIITNPSLPNRVAIIKDGSMYGNDAFQDSASSQPQTGVDTQNGLNVITHSTSVLNLDESLYNIATGNSTIFTIVRKNPADVFGRRILAMGATSNQNTTGLIIQHVGSANLIQFYHGLNNGNVSITATLADYTLITCRRMGTEQYVSVNNGTPITNNNAIDIPDIFAARLLANSFGPGFSFNGNFAFMGIINRGCTNDEISFVNNKLMTIWGL